MSESLAAPVVAKRYIDVPPEILATNVVTSMIEAEGKINLWDALFERLIKGIHAEIAEERENHRATIAGLTESRDAYERDKYTVAAQLADATAEVAMLRQKIARLADEFDSTAEQKYSSRDQSSTVDQGRRRDRLEAAGNAWTDAAKKVRAAIAIEPLKR